MGGRWLWLLALALCAAIEALARVGRLRAEEELKGDEEEDEDDGDEEEEPGDEDAAASATSPSSGNVQSRGRSSRPYARGKLARKRRR